MKCKQCGTVDDYYVRGKYRRCNECHRRSKSRQYHNEKINSPKQRNHQPSRPLSKEIARLSPAILEKRLKTVCIRGHSLTGENVRLDTDSRGRLHRRCLSCDRLKQRKKYGIAVESDMVKLMQPSPWDSLDQ